MARRNPNISGIILYNSLLLQEYWIKHKYVWLKRTVFTTKFYHKFKKWYTSQVLRKQKQFNNITIKKK